MVTVHNFSDGLVNPALGYVSDQSFAVTLPEGYGEDKRKKYRLHVVLHGRDKNLNEVKFLHQFNGERDVPKDQER